VTTGTLSPDRLSSIVVTRAATAVTRRRLLRNAGGAALSIALGGAFLARPQAAWAYGCYDAAGPCGPSPLCYYTTCSGGQCAGNKTKRSHNLYNCSGSNANCWSEYCECGATWAGRYNCCDCCGPGGGGPNCGCGTTCICRSVIGSC
jgi:hypothetical protein